jgi:hypothetical protein
MKKKRGRRNEEKNSQKKKTKIVINFYFFTKGPQKRLSFPSFWVSPHFSFPFFVFFFLVICPPYGEVSHGREGVGVARAQRGRARAHDSLAKG